MGKIIIDIKRTCNKKMPIDIEIVKIGADFEMKEALIYAFKAIFDEEKERKEVIRGKTKKTNS